MRIEDKELEGPDLEREERVHEEAALRHAEEEEEELPVLGGEELHDVELAHRSRLFDAIRLILAEEQVTVSLLYLPQRETAALEALQAAVSGQDHLGEFVYAEDRASLLEQALAVLQENITHGDAEQIAALHGKYDELAERIGELRERLVELEEAQEDEFGEHHRAEKAEGADEGEPAAKPTEPAESDGASTLYGPDLPAAAPAPSTLSGPEARAAPAAAPAPSTLYGDAPGEAAPWRSMLDGPAAPDAPPPASTLYGPDLPAAPTAASTLGDAPGDTAEAAPKKPWWRRPFG